MNKRSNNKKSSRKPRTMLGDRVRVDLTGSTLLSISAGSDTRSSNLSASAFYKFDEWATLYQFWRPLEVKLTASIYNATSGDNFSTISIPWAAGMLPVNPIQDTTLPVSDTSAIGQIVQMPLAVLGNSSFKNQSTPWKPHELRTATQLAADDAGVLYRLYVTLAANVPTGKTYTALFVIHMKTEFWSLTPLDILEISRRPEKNEEESSDTILVPISKKMVQK